MKFFRSDRTLRIYFPVGDSVMIDYENNDGISVYKNGKWRIDSLIPGGLVKWR